MHKLIQTLQASTNCILESPTGTGKTMSLLCAALGWRQHFLNEHGYVEPTQEEWESLSGDTDKFRKPQIVYASRTHGQLAQVVKELKRSNYKPRVVVVGSRQHMCVNPEAMHVNGTARNNYCKELVKSRNCQYHQGIDDHARQKNANDILDIEDLVVEAKQEKFCPYYLMQDEAVQRSADIIFMPYNYLVSPQSRAALKLDWQNAVIIFDEAHNLDGICCEASSFDITPDLIGGCVNEIDRVLNHSRSSGGDSGSGGGHRDQLAMVKAILLDLEAEVQKFPFSPPTNRMKGQSQSFTASGDEVFKLLNRVGITHQNANVLLQYLSEEVITQLEEWRPAAAANPLSLELFRDYLSLLFTKPAGGQQNDIDFAKYFRVHVHADGDRRGGTDAAQSAPNQSGRGRSNAFGAFNANSAKKNARTLSMWCMHPGIALEQIKLLGVRSIVLTSGTLSPVPALASEFAPLKFPFRLENKHVVSSKQIRVLVVNRGVTNKRLDGSFRNRSKPDYLKEMGDTVCYFCRTVPDGLLVFFSSYTMMGQCLAFWQR